MVLKSDTAAPGLLIVINPYQQNIPFIVFQPVWVMYCPTLLIL